MTSIEDKLRELGIDPGWRLCQERGLRRLKCWQDETEEWCPAYKPGVACPGSIIARLIDMVEGMLPGVAMTALDELREMVERMIGVDDDPHAAGALLAVLACISVIESKHSQEQACL